MKNDFVTQMRPVFWIIAFLPGIIMLISIIRFACGG